MKKIVWSFLLLIAGMKMQAGNILVKNVEELIAANKSARPGDVIIMQNGTWENLKISLNCTGTAAAPITLKAQDAGKVIISGHSQLMLGGDYIVVSGLSFKNGFAGNDAIIKFRVDKNQLANHCRVTNTSIDDFNNPLRMDDNHWILFYGKNNRLDHCSFTNKKNMGVLLAVILDDERSRENYHSIDHNYFGFRLPLASNTGEMLRVGVSEHCEFNSRTQITDNLFEHCDGETEVISLKSGRNVVRNNVFKECQGSVVLRHGNYNTVEHNFFLGNDKDGSGGVRIINKGQWVVNNYFYKCRGEGFRSPLSVMNGVPNSPAFRYVEVTDAVIANNSYIDCAPASLCEGSDTERSVVPQNVAFLNNKFLNTRDYIIYNAYDDISGFRFSGNAVSNKVTQALPPGFLKMNLPTEAGSRKPVSTSQGRQNKYVLDSIIASDNTRLVYKLSADAGFATPGIVGQQEKTARDSTGVNWHPKNVAPINPVYTSVSCATAEAFTKLFAGNTKSPLKILLTGNEYNFQFPVLLNRDVIITALKKMPVKISFNQGDDFLFQTKAGNTLSITKVNFDLVNCRNFLTTDTSGSSNHSSFKIQRSVFSCLQGIFFHAAKHSVSDSIIINNCVFNKNKSLLFDFANETDKGLYSVEKLYIRNNRFTANKGQLLEMFRSGNDESTMGPLLHFSGNKIENCSSGSLPLIHLFGTQKSFIERNLFHNTNAGGAIILYEDLVKAIHWLRFNDVVNSGDIVPDKFVQTVANVKSAK
ncbi:MAG: polysaccharide lyase 6 family protein [Ferruginibacter sp.]